MPSCVVGPAACFVISEALTNVVKYARATWAWMPLEREKGHARVEVSTAPKQSVMQKHRPHRSLDQRPPIEEPPPGSDTDVDLGHVRRRDVLGGLIHEYKATA